MMTSKTYSIHAWPRWLESGERASAAHSREITRSMSSPSSLGQRDHDDRFTDVAAGTRHHVTLVTLLLEEKHLEAPEGRALLLHGLFPAERGELSGVECRRALWIAAYRVRQAARFTSLHRAYQHPVARVRDDRQTGQLGAEFRVELRQILLRQAHYRLAAAISRAHREEHLGLRVDRRQRRLAHHIEIACDVACVVKTFLETPQRLSRAD